MWSEGSDTRQMGCGVRGARSGTGWSQVEYRDGEVASRVHVVQCLRIVFGARPERRSRTSTRVNVRSRTRSSALSPRRELERLASSSASTDDEDLVFG